MNEVIWSKKFKFHAWVKKCHFGNFTRKWLNGWIGHALLVQPSKTAHRIFFLFYILIFIQAVCGELSLFCFIEK